jgi:hypothetical protein
MFIKQQMQQLVQQKQRSISGASNKNQFNFNPLKSSTPKNQQPNGSI